MVGLPWEKDEEIVMKVKSNLPYMIKRFLLTTFWIPILVTLIGVVWWLNGAEWPIVIFFLIIGVVSFGIGFLAAIYSGRKFTYIITNRKIIKYSEDICYPLYYNEIEKIKIKYKDKKGRGDIVFVVKKGFNFGANFECLANVEELYAVVAEQWQENKDKKLFTIDKK